MPTSGITLHVKQIDSKKYLEEFENILSQKLRKINMLNWLEVNFFSKDITERSQYSRGDAIYKNDHTIYLVSPTDEKYQNLILDQILSTFRFTK